MSSTTLKLFQAILKNAVFAFNILLLFLTAFRNSLDIPPWLHVAGRMHPLLLHMPIGFMILIVLLVLFRSGFKKKSFQNFLNFVLYFLALTAALAATFGVLLSTEGGYDEFQLNRHLFTGVAVSILSSLLLGISLYLPDNKRVFNFALGLSTVLLIMAGHYGTILTHGENFVWAPLHQENEELIVTDSTSLFLAAIQPVFKSKCTGCHNERKAKGKLILTSEQHILAGGKNGDVWVAGDPGKSNLIKRIHLPEENDDHMPPSGKPQLSAKEKRLLYLWIQKGADMKTAWTHFSPTDSVRILAEETIQQHRKPVLVKHYSFPSVDEATLLNMNTPFCSVTKIASDEPALAADFYLSQEYDKKQLEKLLAVKEQLISINLTRMPVNDSVGPVLSQFTNLEKLNLNQTNISGKLLSALNNLDHLISLSLSGTAVDKGSMSQVATIPTLKEVFLWNTKVTAEQIAELQKEYPSVHWDGGDASNDMLRLTPPLLVNQALLLESNEEVELKNNLPGTQIRYTLDETQPDSVTGAMYSGPIPITGYTNLKAITLKSGWYSSTVSQFHLFKKGIKPVSAELITPADKDYPGEGAKTLIDGKKGMADNFKDVSWIAYRQKPLDAAFSIDSAIPVNKITLSYGENTAAFIFPPASIEVWAGVDKNHTQLVKRIVPSQPTGKNGASVKGIEIGIPSARLQYYRIIARPIERVPSWVTTKVEKGWVFVDEILFN